MLQNKEALRSSTVEHMHSHKRHGIQVVHSASWCSSSTISHCLPPLSSSCKPDPLLQKKRKGKDCAYCEAVSNSTGFSLFHKKWVWLARLVSILSSLVISLLLSSVFHFTFCDYLPLYSHLRLTDTQSRPRKTAN